MNLGKFIYQSRGIMNLVPRVASLFVRFGLRPHRMERHLQTVTDICQSHGLLPSFPITAVILDRHPKIIQHLQAQGVEFAVHGFVHTDYRQLSLEEHRQHLRQAHRIFTACGIPYCGFRAPYLRRSEATVAAVAKHDFTWDSDVVMHWPVVHEAAFSGSLWRAYEKVLELYSSHAATGYRAIPHIRHHVVEIPASIPDDEACVDRLGLKREKQKIAQIWHEILRQSYARGDLFTLQLHHERVPFCDEALDHVLAAAKQCDPPVFTAPLATLAAWWRKRQSSEFKLDVSGDRYQLSVAAPEEATILCRGVLPEQPAPVVAQYRRTHQRQFSGTGRLPGIALSERCHPRWQGFVAEEGFVGLDSGDAARVAHVLDEAEPLTEPRAWTVLQAIDAAETPLVRLWRWPHGCRSALAVTGDIDALTLQDFFVRVREV